MAAACVGEKRRRGLERVHVSEREAAATNVTVAAEWRIDAFLPGRVWSSAPGNTLRAEAGAVICVSGGRVGWDGIASGDCSGSRRRPPPDGAF